MPTKPQLMCRKGLHRMEGENRVTRPDSKRSYCRMCYNEKQRETKRRKARRNLFTQELYLKKVNNMLRDEIVIIYPFKIFALKVIEKELSRIAALRKRLGVI